MSLDVMTLALAKSYADQHGGGGGGGESTIYIPATVVDVSDEGVVTIKTSVTFEQIDAAYKSGQEQILKLFVDGSGEDSCSMPLIFANPGSSYNFGVILSGYGFFAEVGSTDKWSASMLDFSIHTHYNKDVLDHLYVHPDYPDNLVFYDSFVETKPAQITSGSDITLADNTEYRLQGVNRLKLTYPEGNFECWMRLSFTDYGTINVTFPSTTQYIGTTPDFKEDETWELSIKDGVVIAQKVGDGI